MLLDGLEAGCRRGAEVRAATGRLLRPYQIEGVARCLHGNQLLGFEMGTGKSGSALAAVSHVERVAFVVPAVALEVWRREVTKWTTRRSLVELRGVRNLTATLRQLDAAGRVVEEHPATSEDLQSEWLLMTHESARSWGSLMVPAGELSLSRADPKSIRLDFPRRVGALVVDEVHRFGDRRGQGTLAVMTAARAADRVILLSGTPAKGGPHRLWAPLTMIAPGAWGSYYDFIRRYAGAAETDFGLQPTEATNVEELAYRLRPWALVYTRAQVGSSMPPHTRQRLVVPLNAKAMQRLGPIMESAAKRLKERGEVRSQDAWESPEIVALRIALADLKIPETARLVGDLLAAGQKVVVWAWHREVVHRLSAALELAKVRNYVRVTGEIVDEGLVDQAVEAWARNPAPTALLATIAKLGEARDLTAACFQIFLEVDFLPETVNQAESRLVRLSQMRPVTTYLMGLELPFEQSLLDRIEARALESDALLGTASAAGVGALFGRPVWSDAEALQAFARNVG